MIKIFSTRRNIIIAGVATAAVIGSAGAAFAYFGATGTGTGSATVGAAGSWTVKAGNESGGPIYPGSGTETIAFSVKNSGKSPMEYTTATPSVNADSNGYVTVNGATLTGCKADWFTASIADPTTDDQYINTEIPAGTAEPVTVTVTMTDTSDNQTVCAGASPDIDLTVN